MKTYGGNLFEKVISFENIMGAIKDASQGGMKSRKLKTIAKHPEQYYSAIKRYIFYFNPFTHKTRIINDGISAKKRTIIVPTVAEHIMHHAVMRVLKPIFLKGMYKHSYASIPGGGCHNGAKTVKKWIKRGGRDIKYCLKMDIKKFFESIDQEVLIQLLRIKIRDQRFLALLEEIIHTTDKGLPLGFYTSQWFANFLLQGLDHFIKETLKAKYYIRYMDDMVIFGSNKRQLHYFRYAIEQFYLKLLHLKLKENWQVFRFHTKNNKGRCLDYMGFKFYRNRTALRKSITKKAMRKALRIYKKQIDPNKKVNVKDARQIITYKGWTKASNTYNWLQKYILKYVSFREMRKIISKHDRKVAKLRCLICGLIPNPT